MAINTRTLGIGIGALVLLAGGGFYAWQAGWFGSAPVTPPVATPPAAPAAPAEPPVQHPIPPGSLAQPAPPPPLAESDPFVRDALTELFGPDSVERSFARQNLARRIVATIDNLPREKVAIALRPVAPAPGKFLVTGPEDHRQIDPRNFERYRPAVTQIAALDVHRLAAVYFRIYPVLQSAYEGLGFPSAYFNDRLVAVIDHLLETPDVEGPIDLVQPRVLYEYADPALEKRSAGQKLLLRMGPENSAVIKRKLRELRNEVAKSPPPGARP